MAECFFLRSSLLSISLLLVIRVIPDVGDAGGLLLDFGAVHARQCVVDFDDFALSFLVHWVI
jgi:hypothetical protein